MKDVRKKDTSATSVLAIGSRRRLLGAVALSLASAASSVGLLATSAWLISRAAQHPPVLYLMVAVVAVRALGLARGVFRYAERLVGHDVALRLQAGLRLQTYSAVAGSTWIGRRSGDLLSRVTDDVAAVQDRVVRVVVPLASGGLVLVGAGLLITVLSPGAGVLLLACSVFGGLVVPLWVGRCSVRSDQRRAELRGRLAEVTMMLADTAPDLIAYQAAGPLLQEARQADAALATAERRSARTAGIAAAAQYLAAAIAVVGALLIGAAGVVSGRLPVVELAVLALTPLALQELLATLPPAVQAARRTAGSLQRVRELIAAVPVGVGDRLGVGDRQPMTSSTGRGGLAFRDLAVGWPGAPTVVEHLSLSAAPGEWVGLTGPSGAGKTTVAASALGLIPTRAGSVEVSGSVGYLAQHAHLFDTTVAENLRIGRRDAGDDELTAVLGRVGLSLSLDRLVGEYGTRVSGGEARRIAFARLLLADHDVLILDEPTEHLDRPTADALVEDLVSAGASRAVLVISHDPALLARCDRIVELSPLRSDDGGNPTRADLLGRRDQSDPRTLRGQRGIQRSASASEPARAGRRRPRPARRPPRRRGSPAPRSGSKALTPTGLPAACDRLEGAQDGGDRRPDAVCCPSRPIEAARSDGPDEDAVDAVDRGDLGRGFDRPRPSRSGRTARRARRRRRGSRRRGSSAPSAPARCRRRARRAVDSARPATASRGLLGRGDHRHQEVLGAEVEHLLDDDGVVRRHPHHRRRSGRRRPPAAAPAPIPARSGSAPCRSAASPARSRRRSRPTSGTARADPHADQRPVGARPARRGRSGSDEAARDRSHRSVVGEHACRPGAPTSGG